jgi:hypothetical protein
MDNFNFMSEHKSNSEVVMVGQINLSFEKKEG